MDERLLVAFGRAPVVATAIVGMAEAAVAAVFRPGPSGTELLLIERAHRVGDPWSGHMALPGGRVDPTDPHGRGTAERETFEEVGLDLQVASYLGRLDDLQGGARPIIVSAHGYWLTGERPALLPNHEVADTLWVPLDHLANPASAVDYRYPERPEEVFPGIEVCGGRVVWGMTWRLLQDLFERFTGFDSPRGTR